MNTVLECLSNGVPMVAIPITNDQPAVATRIAWTKTGEVIPLDRCSISELAAAIKSVLYQDSYRQNAEKFKREIEQVGGANKAADIIEEVINSRVLN